MESYPNDPTVAWSEGYMRGGALVGLIVFAVTVIVLWRGFIRTWGPLAGLIGGMIPAGLGAALMGVVAAFTWPVWLIAPVPLYLAHRQKRRLEHDERLERRMRSSSATGR